LTISGVIIAFGVILPIAFHAFGETAGQVILPMHIPVLIGAFFLPWTWAGAVGLITPLLSTLLTGMPPIVATIPVGIMMPFELATYGIIISLLRKTLVTKEKWYSPLFALIPAMLAGRIVSGLVFFILLKIYLAVPVTPWAFVTGGIVTGLPGIAIQIILIPILYHVLIRNLKWYNQ
jgi:hypothetical protein